MTAPPLRYELVVPDSARLGEPVTITIRITNTSAEAVDAYFVGREIAFDIVVRKSEGGEVVWRRLEGKAVQQVLQVRHFKPGETLELSDVWKPRQGGHYLVEGVVMGDTGERKTGERHIVVARSVR